MEPQVIGPDGRPALYQGTAWVSSDGTQFWNGSEWAPLGRATAIPSRVLVILGACIVGIALVFLYPYISGYMGITGDPYVIGYYVGVGAFFLVLFAIFRFVGRWQTVGLFIRMACALLAVLKVLTLIAHPPPG